MITCFKDLDDLDLIGTNVAVVWPADKETIDAVLAAEKRKNITPIMIGDLEIIKALIEENHLSKIAIHPVSTPEEAAVYAVQLAKKDKVQGIMKGKIETKILLKEVVNHLVTDGQMSHFVVHELDNYPKLLALSDGGMNMYPTLEQKGSILENSVNALKQLGVNIPHVAVLAAVEKVNPKMVETLDAQSLKDKYNGLECVVEGPISYDLAMSKKSAKLKNYSSPVVGNVDLLLVPNITVGNILGKALVYSANAKMAGVVLGGKVPIILTSRGSSFEEKYYSILLSGQIERG